MKRGEGNDIRLEGTYCANGCKVLGGICEKSIGLLGGLFQQALELRPSVGEAVVDVVGEGVQCAHGGLLLGRVS